MILTLDNSWHNVGGLWQDPDLKGVLNSPLHYRPEPFSFTDCQQSAVFTLRGPRRAGKTVALKLLVARLIEEQGWSPHQIAWTTFDTIGTLAHAEKHLEQIAKDLHPRLLLIDEITSILGWQRVIKKLRDNGTLAEMCVIVTGSSAHDLKAGAERMAGRRGLVQAPDRILLPMSFGDFKAQLEKSSIQMSDQDACRAFLMVGGFPFRVEAFIRAHQAGRAMDPFEQFQIFDDVIFYEFARRRLDRSLAIEVLGRLATIRNSATSYEAFAKPISAAKDTVRKYLDALGDSFLLATLSSYDTSRGRVAPRKDRKFSWIDPALGGVGTWLKQAEPASESDRAEWAVGAELLRRHETRIWEGLSSPRGVFTWKSTGGNEIDFLVVDKSRKLLFPVEVKYQNSICDWDFQVMERAFGKGCLVTRDHDQTRAKSAALALPGFLLKRESSPQ